MWPTVARLCTEQCKHDITSLHKALRTKFSTQTQLYNCCSPGAIGTLTCSKCFFSWSILSWSATVCSNCGAWSIRPTRCVPLMSYNRRTCRPDGPSIRASNCFINMESHRLYWRRYLLHNCIITWRQPFSTVQWSRAMKHVSMSGRSRPFLYQYLQANQGWDQG